jgi:hypothetical protein
VGAIVALSPAVTPAQKAVFLSWGPGKYDPRFNIDGLNTPLVIPPAYGLANVKNETYTAEGPLSYWNAYVAVTQMHGHGNFTDPRLGISIIQQPDLVTSKLPAFAASTQHSLPVHAVAARQRQRGQWRSGARQFSTGLVRVVMSVANGTTTTVGSCTHRRRREWILA